jgi:NADPH:quinone reductase
VSRFEEQNMRAVRVQEFGAPDVLHVGEADQPSPSAGQVLIAVEVAGVLFGDTIVRRGAVPFPLPYVPGMEIGGVVVAGDEKLIGRRVVATTAGLSGGYADYALADQVHVVPPDLSMEHAVALFGAGSVAAGLLRTMSVGPDDTVLITAAAGRIGSLLVQLAKAAGARVIGAAGPGKLQAVREFGADEAVDYGTWSGEASVVLDAVGGKIGEQAIAVATDRVGLYGFASGAWPALDAAVIAERGLTVIGPFAKLRSRTPAEQSDDVAKALTGGLTPRIHAVHPLEQAARAHVDLEERRNIGTVLLSVK